MKKTKTQKGITLIALIITIIVLLILAIVTIGAIKNDGLIQYAQNARKDYTDAANQEQEDLNTLLGKIEGNVPGSNGEGTDGENKEEEKEDSKTEITWQDNGDGTFTATDGTKVAIGDYVNYTYDTASDYSLSATYSGYSSDQTCAQTTGLQWRVMGISEAGELELISVKPTSTSVTFSGATGYNNGVYILNNICKKQYSNQELGITARSLSIEDIEKRYTEAGKSARDSFTAPDYAVEYGSTKTYGSGDNSYPTIYGEEALSGVTGSIREGGISQSDPCYTSENALTTSSTSIGTASGNLMVTQIFYGLSDTLASCFDNSTFYDMIFGSNTCYWLASRSVYCDWGYASFSLRIVGSDLNGSRLFSSDGINLGGVYYYLRPVVSLGPEILVETNAEANSEANMWKISKK